MLFQIGLKNKIKKIKLVILDIDGVLTDGGIYYDNRGIEQKKFHVRDGAGIKIAIDAGIPIVIVTGRESHIVRIRAKELNITKVYQGAMKKYLYLEKIKKEFHVENEEIAFIADDIIDLELLKKVGCKVAVNDAVSEVKKNADYICRNKGGNGAVREFIEMMLRVKKIWYLALKRYK